MLIVSWVGSSSMRSLLRKVFAFGLSAKRVFFCVMLAATLHVATEIVDLYRGSSYARRVPVVTTTVFDDVDLSTERSTAAHVLTRILEADGVLNASSWGRAIARHAVSLEPGYLALCMAQLRRESNFLATDPETLITWAMPAFLQAFGFHLPFRTVGPLQIGSRRFQELVERRLGRSVEGERELIHLAHDLDVAVAASLDHLDRLVREYRPLRDLGGFANRRGRMGLQEPEGPHHPDLWNAEEREDRRVVALFQKMVSDLADEPLVLDGVFGERTRSVAAELAALDTSFDRQRYLQDLVYDATLLTSHERWWGPAFSRVRSAWESIYGPCEVDGITPRLAHDPWLAFVVADHNAGLGACRIAATQHMLNALFESGLAVDGIPGPRTVRACIDALPHVTFEVREREELARQLASPRDRRTALKRVRLELMRVYAYRLGEVPPEALVPDRHYGSTSQELKGIGRMSTRAYVIGSVRFFESYLVRVHAGMRGAGGN